MRDQFIKNNIGKAAKLGYLSLIVLLAPNTCSAETNENIHLAVYAGYSQLHDDHYASLIKNGEAFNKSKSFGLTAGYDINSTWRFGLDVRKQEEFSSDSYSSLAEISINQSFIALYAQQHFPWHNGFTWYLKESLGLLDVKQQQKSRQGVDQEAINDQVFFPSLAIGFKKAFEDQGSNFNWFAQFEYSAYQLENSTDTYNMRLTTFSTGIEWLF